MKTNRKKCTAVFIAFCMTLMQVMFFPERAAAEDVPDFSVLGAVGDFTEAETQAIAQVIYKGILAHEEEILLQVDGVPQIGVDEESIDTLGSIYRTVVSHWDAGILIDRSTMWYRPSNVGIYSVIPSYLVEDETYEAEYEWAMGMLDEIASGVDESWSDPEKALYLHEWMTVHYDYDNTSYADAAEESMRHMAYGMLKRNKAVCDGYAWLYGLLLRRVGIESQMVISTSLKHAWNLVEIDDAWYHVDVTWDDGYDFHPGLVSHTSFLKGNEAIAESGHTCTDWTLSTGTPISEMNVSDKYDNAFWSDSISVVQPYANGRWLTIKQGEDAATGWFTSCDFDAVSGISLLYNIMSLSDKWYVSGSTTQFYTESYIVTSVYNGIAYYTTPYTMFALKDGAVIWMFNLTDEQKENGSIYGMYVDDDVMHYYVSKNPLAAPVEYTVNLASYVGILGEEAIATTTTAETTTTEPETTTTEAETTITEPETTTTETETTTTELETTTTETETTTTELETTTTETETTTTELETTTTETETTTTEPETTTTETETTTTEPETTTTETETTTTEPETTTTEAETTTTEPETTTTETETTTTEPKTTTTEAETTTVTEITETTETTTTEPLLPYYGDVNGDNQVTIVDIIALQRYLMGDMPLNDHTAENSDLTHDGMVNVFDLARLKRSLIRSK